MEKKQIMSDNIIVKFLENQQRQRDLDATQQTEWGLLQRERLVEILEKNGAIITNNMWDALLFKVNGLIINDSGSICYISFDNPSKRIIALLAKHSDLIRNNFNYITGQR